MTLQSIQMKIFLKKNEEKRLLTGHLWVFSNEILKVENLSANGVVSELYTYNGKFLGKGFYNKDSLIAYRHLTNSDIEIDKKFFSEKIRSSFQLRNKILNHNSAYRIVNSESDFLPGLIIDKYSDSYSIQIFSLGMQGYIDIIKEILVEEYSANLVAEKNDFEYRALEGLPKLSSILYGDEKDSRVVIVIDGIKYSVDILKGQKTGFYLDQNENRFNLRKFVSPGDSVLDLFCNDGGFSLNASLAGAKDILSVDSSEIALNNLKNNFTLNNFENYSAVNADVFDFVKSRKDKRYDIVILDPPSLTKSKKNIPNALQGYFELNKNSMELINDGGYLFTYSCSHHITEIDFIDVLRKSARKASKKIRMIDFSNCSIDHPVNPAMSETKYLKGVILKVN